MERELVCREAMVCREGSLGDEVQLLREMYSGSHGRKIVTANIKQNEEKKRKATVLLC